MNGGRTERSLRAIALLESAKGLLVLLAGCGLLSLIHRNLHLAAAELLRHFHLNPAGHYPRIFLDLLERVDDRRLWFLAGAALLYAILRLIEAYGLWRQRRWAEWFGVISGAIYLPLEGYEVVFALSWATVVVLAVNLCVVWFLARALVAEHDSVC